MIEKNNLNIDAICEYFDQQISIYAGFIVENEEEDSDRVTYKCLDSVDWLLFDFCKKDAVIDSLNEELGVLDAGIAVTDYEIDEETGYIQFRIE